MKKLVLPVIAATLLFSACKKSDSDAPLTGKWYLDYTSVRVTSDGTLIKDTTITAVPSGQYFEFTQDSLLYTYLYDTATGTFYTDTLGYQRTANQIITTAPETDIIKIITGSELLLYNSWKSGNTTSTVLTETSRHFHR